MDYEKEASKQGWVPEERWEGPPEKWVDAETFVKRGEHILPIMTERFNTLSEKHDSLKSEMEQLRTLNEGLKSSLQKFNENYNKTLDSERKRIIRELQADRKAAIADDDIEKADAISDEIAKVKSAQQPEPPKQQPVPEPSPDFNAWVAQNDWYLQDRELSDYADFVGTKLSGTLTGRKFFDAVEERVKKMFPHKFGDKQSQYASVDGGMPVDIAPSNAKKATYRDLPPDAKAVCDQLVKDKEITREDYIKFYFGGANV